MTKAKQIEERVDQVILLIGDLVDEIVLVGGSTMPFLVTDTAAPDLRFTTDVDFLVEVATRSQYEVATGKLIKKGFSHDKNGPICRFRNNQFVVVDLMPTEEEILGFGGKGSKLAFENNFHHKLPSGTTVRVVTAPCLLYLKFEAYNDRGATNSKDLEDIIALVNGRKELFDELLDAPPEIIEFVVTELQQLLQSEVIHDLDQYLPYGANDQARVLVIKERLQEIAQIEI